MEKKEKKIVSYFFRVIFSLYKDFVFTIFLYIFHFCRTPRAVKKERDEKVRSCKKVLFSLSLHFIEGIWAGREEIFLLIFTTLK